MIIYIYRIHYQLIRESMTVRDAYLKQRKREISKKKY